MTIVDITHESPRVDGPAEHSMLFSPPMVRALLAEIARPGTGKTQTRRIVSAHNSEVLGHRYRATSPAWAGLDFTRAEARTRSTMMLAIAGKDAPFDLHLSVPWKHPDDPPGWEATYRVRPVWEVGDRIVVRETTYIAPPGFGERFDCNRADAEGRPRLVGYAASMDGEGVRCANDYGVKATPSLLMPRWAARIVLIVTEVRVQRIQEISEDDAEAEGVRFWHQEHVGGDRFDSEWCRSSARVASERGEPRPFAATAVGAFRLLWDKINGKRPGCSWADSPWVWAITFKPELISSSASGVGPAASAAPLGGREGRTA